MNKEEIIEKKSLQLDLADPNSTNLLVQALNELKKNGYEKVIVDIKTSTEQKLKKFGLDINIFEKIKERQELPDWVVVNLMLVEGKLKDSNFKARWLNE